MRLRWLPWLLSVSSALGCGRLLDADRYRVTSAKNPCSMAEVPTAAGCQPVGVRDCAKEFEADGKGGCVPLLPKQACGDALLALPGARECRSVTRLACGNERFGPPPADDSLARRYVDVAAPAGGDGSLQRPLRSLSEAIDSLPGEGAVLLAAGTYRVNLGGVTKPLHLIGACPETTHLAAEPGAPTIELGPLAAGSSIERLSIEGGSAGIAASNVAGLLVSEVWIHDVDGPGIVLDDDSAVTAQVYDTLIERVVEGGIVAYGADLHVERANVRDVSASAENARAPGISIRAAARFEGDQAALRQPGALELSQAAIENSVGAGVFVEESSLELDISAISAIAPDDLGFSRGIDVRGSFSQTLEASAVVRRSFVEKVHEIGIVSFAANLSLSDDTIRSVGDQQSDGCRGIGVLAAFPLEKSPAAPSLELEHVSVQSVGGVGIELGGAPASLHGVSVRNELDSGCSGAIGVRSRRSAVNSHPDLVLEECRVEGFARGVVSGDDDVEASDDAGRTSLADSLLVCNGEPLLSPPGFAGSPICGCGDEWRYCEPSPAPPDLGCVADETTTCLKLCLEQLNNNGVPSGVSVWAFDHPSVPSRRSSAKGCVELSGVPRGQPFVVATSSPGFGPGIGMVAPIDQPEATPSHASLIDVMFTGYFNFLTSLGEDPGVTDTRLAALVAAQACTEPAPPPEERPEKGPACPPLEGATARLEPGDYRAYYFDDANQLNQSVPAIDESPDVVFARVRPGMSRLSLVPADGARVECRPERWGWRADEPNTFLVHAEPGFTELGAELVCTPVTEDSAQ